MIFLNLWRQNPGRFFCISTKDRAGMWKDSFFQKKNLTKAVPRFIENNRDKDLYFCPHGFAKPRRLKKYAEVPRLLWADLDEADPRDMKGLTPTVAWESSPGRYAALWVLTDFMNEELNRRLTYHLKADHGGWDMTQVLRIPGTLNFKYTSTPMGRLLWNDGRSYTAREIDKALPKNSPKAQGGKSIALGLYKKYESKFSSWVRQQLLKGKPKPGKRSEVMWKLAHEIVEAGASRDEAFELLRTSPWNKFDKRRDGDEQLRREIDKAVEQHLVIDNDEEPLQPRYGDENEEDEDEEYHFLAKSMNDVEEENIDWVWYPYLARGEVTILEGDPGLGKSYMAQMVAKGICDGERLPSVKGKKAPIVTGKVAYFDMENSMGSVTKKRLVGNGMKNLGAFYQEPEPFSIDDEETLNRVYEALEKLKPVLCVFDTLNTYIGKADTHNAAETVQAFNNFVQIARRFKCSVMVLRHLTKSSKEKAIYRGQGSIGFTGSARFVLTVGTSPDDADVRAMAVTKINVVKAPRALTWSIEGLPDTATETDRSRFTWGQFVDYTADDIIVQTDREKDESGLQVQDWLGEALADGPVEQRALFKMGSTRSYTDKQINKAGEALEVLRKTRNGSTVWRLAEGIDDAN